MVPIYALMENKKTLVDHVADQDFAFMIETNQYVFPAEAPKYAYMTDKKDNAETAKVQPSVSMERGDHNV